MTKSLYAALLTVAVAAAPAAAQTTGPRPSSYDNWPGAMQQAALPTAAPETTPFDGPRPSSAGNWGGSAANSNPNGLAPSVALQLGPRASGH